MGRESSNVGQPRDVGRKQQLHEAFDILFEARERLVAQLAEEVVAHRDVILEGCAEDGLFRYEFQELEDRYSARLQALNSILENLEHLDYHHPRLRHRLQTLTTTRDRLESDVNAAISRQDQWDLVNIQVTPLPALQDASTPTGDSALLVVMAFTTDEVEETPPA